MKCVRQLPVIEKLADEFSGRVTFIKVDSIDDASVLEAFDAGSYPAYLVFRDGVEVDRLSLNFAPWYLEERIRGMLEDALATN